MRRVITGLIATGALGAIFTAAALGAATSTDAATTATPHPVASHAVVKRAPTPRLPIVHSGAHPGAAQLAGDIKHPVHATPIPSDARHDYFLRACQVQHAARVPVYCAQGSTRHPRFTVALIGDSMAGEWIPTMGKIAAAHHWKFVFATHSSCPFGATMPVVPNTGRQYVQCHAWAAAVLSHLVHVTHPDVVIVGDRPMEGSLHHRHPAASAYHELGLGMADFWRQLLAAKTAVVGIHETPERHGLNTTARRTAIRANTPIVVAARNVKAAHLINLNNDICGQRFCYSIVGNVRVYRDSHHMTRTYALTLAPYLERVLLRIPVFAKGG